jgi:hypothetical protein
VQDELLVDGEVGCEIVAHVNNLDDPTIAITSRE